MTDSNLEGTSYAWKKIAADWQKYFTTPSRPSEEEVKRYNVWLRQINPAPKTRQKGLVLGATPELRDALFSSGFSVSSLDINLEMMLAMTELLKHPDPDEVLVRASWLESPLESGLFDVILGDAVLPNIPWNTRTQFFKQIYRMMAPGGYFINRAFFVPELKPFKNLDEVLEKYKDVSPGYKTATELVFDLHILTYDSADHLGSMQKVKNALSPLRKSAGFDTGSSNLDETLSIIWGNWLDSAADKVWLYPYRSEEEAEYKSYFEIAESFEATDHPHGKLTPMYLLRKK